MKGIVLFRDFLRRFPFLIATNSLLLVVQGLIGAISIFTVAPIIDFFINPALEHASPVTRQSAAVMKSIGLPMTLASFLAVFLGFQILKNAFIFFARHYTIRTKYAVLQDLIVGTFEDFFQARWLFFSSNKQGTILNTFLREMTVVGNAFMTMATFFASLFQFILYLAVPFYISWQVTTVSLVTGLFLTWPLLMLGKINYRLGRLNTSTANEFTGVIQEGLSLAKVILGFSNQHKSVEALAKAYDAHRRTTVKFQTLAVATSVIHEPAVTVVLVTALLTARNFGIPISEMAVLLWALRNSIPSLGELTVQKNSLANFTAGYEQVKNLREQARELRQQSGQIPFTGFQREISVERLTFAYPGYEPTLVDINLRVPKGKMIAIVGESGAGKSSLIDMIMGFHEPSSGRVALDGAPLEEFDISSYRRRIGYVPQDSVLFNMTIRDNLLWANEAATDAEIKEACRQANADEFIGQFPDGYDTLVGDRGVRLSGGQCQRVALARAVLRKPELLILDEATSSLDTHSERLIQRAIETIAKETTVIVVAHRLSTIVNADYIYVLKDGRLVEEGTYRALLRKQGHFSHMTELQVLAMPG